MEIKESIPARKFQNGDKVRAHGIEGVIASGRYGMTAAGVYDWIHDLWYKKSTGGMGNLGHIPASEITLISSKDSSTD